MHDRFLVLTRLLPRKSVCFFFVSVTILAVLSALTGFDALAVGFVQQSSTARMHFWQIVTVFGLSGYMFAMSGTISISSLLLVWQTRDEKKTQNLEILAHRSAYFFS